jgi:hypothetical protein
MSAKAIPFLRSQKILIFRNNLLIPSPNQLLMSAVSSLNEGRIAVVTNVGWECGGRDSVVARFWCADERRSLRTAKSCGPDAPLLASSS